jgi:hypothetical protein
MSGGEIARQQAHYRRGLVLGLTVAESMLLILFALLLALGAVLMKRDSEARAAAVRLARLEAANRLLEAKADVFGAMAEHKPTDEFFQELVRARQQAEQVAREKAELVEREKAVAGLERLSRSLQGSPDKAKRMRELAAVGARLEQELARRPGGQGKTAPFDEIAQGVSLAEAARENGTLRGQVVKLRQDLKSVGRGGDYPPCWVTPAGEIEYLFDIALNGSGSLSVTDVTPPARLVDRRALPIPPGLFSGPVSRARFLSDTQALLDLSRAKDCRFYVIARDRTGPTQKDLFKALLINTVEARFYKVIRR